MQGDDPNASGGENDPNVSGGEDDSERDWTVTVVDNDGDWEATVDLRMAVFVDEQGVPEELELDEHDEDPTTSDVDHLLVRDADGDPVAVARLRAVDRGHYGTDLVGDSPDDGTAEAARIAKVERVAVARDRRGEGWGAQAMRAAEERARERGLPAVVLHAQTTATGFYERLGYEVDDERGVFDEDGIDHVRMRRRL